MGLGIIGRAWIHHFVPTLVARSKGREHWEEGCLWVHTISCLPRRNARTGGRDRGREIKTRSSPCIYGAVECIKGRSETKIELQPQTTYPPQTDAARKGAATKQLIFIKIVYDP